MLACGRPGGRLRDIKGVVGRSGTNRISFIFTRYGSCTSFRHVILIGYNNFFEFIMTFSKTKCLGKVCLYLAFIFLVGASSGDNTTPTRGITPVKIE